MGMVRSGTIVSLHNNRLRGNYVLVDRSLLMGATIDIFDMNTDSNDVISRSSVY